MKIRLMTIEDYPVVYDLWIHTSGMGLNNMDDTPEGIHKAALVVFEKNQLGNAFWENMGFSERTDLIYRNKGVHDMIRMDT